MGWIGGLLGVTGIKSMPVGDAGGSVWRKESQLQGEVVGVAVLALRAGERGVCSSLFLKQFSCPEGCLQLSAFSPDLLLTVPPDIISMRIPFFG